MSVVDLWSVVFRLKSSDAIIRVSGPCNCFAIVVLNYAVLLVSIQIDSR